MKTILSTFGIAALLSAQLTTGTASGAPAGMTTHGTAKALSSGVPADSSPSAGETKPATGTLKMPYEKFGVSLVTIDGRTMREYEGQGGSAAIPTGNYWVTSWWVHLRDAAGIRWVACGGPQGQPHMAIGIRAGKTTELHLATPLATQLTVEQVDGQFSFLLQFRGTVGDRCHRVYKDLDNPPVPRLRIVDAEGAEVTVLEFKYGCAFFCLRQWEAPKDVKWPLRGILQVDFGPFPVQIGDPIVLQPDGTAGSTVATSRP
jgi:hypothetical protein